MVDSCLTSQNEPMAVLTCRLDTAIRTFLQSRKVESVSHQFHSLATISLSPSCFMSLKPQKSSQRYFSPNGDRKHEKWKKTGSFPITRSNRTFLSLVAAATPSNTSIAKNHIPEPMSSDKTISLFPFMALLCIEILAPTTKTGLVIAHAAALLVGAYYADKIWQYYLKDVAATSPPVTERNIAGYDWKDIDATPPPVTEGNIAGNDWKDVDATPPPVTEGNVAGATPKSAVYVNIATSGSHINIAGATHESAVYVNIAKSGSHINIGASSSWNNTILLNLSRGM